MDNYRLFLSTDECYKIFVHQPYWPDPTHKEADLFKNSLNKCKGVGFESRISLLHSGYIEVPLRGAAADIDYALYGQLGF